MKRVAVGLLAVAVIGTVAGCSTPKKNVTSDKTPFELMQDKANAITAAGGLAAVGIGQSATVSLAIDKAKTRGRTELAHIIETKVESLKKDFNEEVGEGAGSEYNALFSAASKSIASQVLRGSVPKDLKYATEGGQTTAWALMVQDPKVIADAFAAEANTQRHLYTRFRASQAFNELDAEVKKFDEFKKQDASGVANVQ
jgi:hypothetical protein